MATLDERIMSRSRPCATRQRMRLLFNSRASAMRRLGSIRVLRLCLLATRRPEKSSSQRGTSLSEVDSVGDILSKDDFWERRYDMILTLPERRRLGWRVRNVRRFWRGCPWVSEDEGLR